MPVAASTDSIQNLILTILAVVIIIVAVWSIYAFIRAVFSFIFSQWKEEKIKKAWNSIRYMIMGIFLSVFILFMFPLVFKRVWVDNHEEYSAKNIFNKAWTIINKTFKLKDIVKESQKKNQYEGNLYYEDNFSERYVEDYSL
jgi:formate hydrogenlyase subunit 3/multisubunit Na+/H+ antiporter MnhD subunit